MDKSEHDICYILRWLDSPWVFILEFGENTIGRHSDSHFLITDPSVSDFHAMAELTEHGVFVNVLQEGAKRTKLNGVQIDGRAVMLPGMVLTLGKVKVLFEVSRKSLYPNWFNGDSVDKTKK